MNGTNSTTRKGMHAVAGGEKGEKIRNFSRITKREAFTHYRTGSFAFTPRLTWCMSL